MSKPFYYNISFLRVFAMIMVVLGHTLMYDSPIMLGVYKIIYSFHMPLFVFISGYLFMNSQSRKQNNFFSVVINKFKRLIVPCIIVGLFWIIPTHIFISRDLGISITEIWVKIKDVLTGNVENLWFLLMLFWTTILFYPISKMIRSKYSYIAIPIIGIMVIWFFINTSLYTMPNFYSISQVSKYLYYFYLGAIFYIYREKIDTFIRKNRFISLLVSGLLVLNCQQYILVNYETYIGAWFITEHLKIYIFSSTITIIFLYIFAVCFEHVFETWFMKSKIFSFLDRKSLEIYFIHAQLGTIVIQIISKIKVPLTTFNKIFILFISMLILSSLLIFIINKVQVYFNQKIDSWRKKYEI